MKPRCPEGKRFLIIGGGPAGLFMAIQCLLRGHSVTLIEQRTEYDRAVACGLLETEVKFFQLIDIEEIMMKIVMKMGGLIYLGCQFDPKNQKISSYSQSKSGIRCWDGLKVDQEESCFDYDNLIIYGQIISKNHLCAIILALFFCHTFCRKYLFPKLSSIITLSSCLNHHHRFNSIKEFLLDKSYDGGAMIVKRLQDKTEYLDDWLRNVEQQHILNLSQYPLLAMVAHIPAKVFISYQPQKQVRKMPTDWIFIPCFTSSENINNNQINTVQFEGPLPIHYDQDSKKFPVYEFFTALLNNYLKVSLKEIEWNKWCKKDKTFKNYSQRSIRSFPQQFETLLQYGRLHIERKETGDIIVDYERSKCSMWGHFTDPNSCSTQKEFLVIGDSLCSPYYRFGIGLHNATRTVLSYFHPDPNERLRQMLDVEISLVKQIILTLFSQSSSFQINESDFDLQHLIDNTLQKKLEDNVSLHENHLHDTKKYSYI
ncbi:unnamed protein product [Rotaria sp. Silwood2]|nr:unnamed protein product [Rotaria sp. Silwood2]